MKTERKKDRKKEKRNKEGKIAHFQDSPTSDTGALPKHYSCLWALWITVSYTQRLKAWQKKEQRERKKERTKDGMNMRRGEIKEKAEKKNC